MSSALFFIFAHCPSILFTACKCQRNWCFFSFMATSHSTYILRLKCTMRIRNSTYITYMGRDAGRYIWKLISYSINPFFARSRRYADILRDGVWCPLLFLAGHAVELHYEWRLVGARAKCRRQMASRRVLLPLWRHVIRDAPLNVTRRSDSV